ncbi:UPF0175 family protein [Halolamina sp.]|jgi:hypothetical protein|uniref:UPF0175 family protein n=1 Tax=Halolamina sp. TaxID=1940283 RepID=UPI000223C0BD|nr:protein of unknown function UPF0175 [halophilic archaeon DL31]
MSSIDLPADVLDAIAAPPDEREPIVQQELAVSLYREGYLSFGKTRELAGLTKADFHQLLGERGVERHTQTRTSRSMSSTPRNDGCLEHVPPAEPRADR